MATDNMTTFALDETVDFVIVGSGSAGGILAKELSTAGFSVVVLEQGPFRQASDFSHDEFAVLLQGELNGGPPEVDKQTFRDDESKVAEVPQGGGAPGDYVQGVGGTSVHFSANFWRLREIDFRERSALGQISGTNFADWPISYEELEPYYTRVDWEIGVSGAPGPFDSPRSKPFPVPPMPIKSSGALLEKGAKAIGLHPQPAPVAILSQPHNGRAACIHCGYCMGFGCEVGAKSSTLVAMIPQALASGNCEIRAECAVYNLKLGTEGRVDEVEYIDPEGNQRGQKARAVIVSANGAETSRLLLMSANPQHPNGLANSSGFVGRNLMFNAHALVHGVFEQPLNDWKSIQCTRIVHDHYESDPSRGFYGGGGYDARPFLAATPIMYGLMHNPTGQRWGAEYKDRLAHDFNRRMTIACNATSLPLDRNNVTLDPTHKDKWGRPSLRFTYRDHDDDMANALFMQKYAEQMMDAAGALQRWSNPVHAQNGSAHLLGTCRMGDDPSSSVVDRYHRSHDVANLFICDGSSMVTSGRGQPTMTIMALAFRAAEHIAQAARANRI
ncbi:MAG: GMC family oxidoreductase [Gammaproteobacteria bacterium]|nr:GMC family oxidoreductase [Gammaproteobacteria bacterium]MDH4255990.1 GMC family oxidoreductase [Gammaproteobacteria bacterium]MDH5309243.1 GMC family oxidoreductase [Gammaproteobacteria bacterium]